MTAVWCTQERATGLWHAVVGEPDEAATFDPIACSTAGEGIVFPGRRERRRPTCPDCMEARQ